MQKNPISSIHISRWFTLGIPLIIFFILFLGLPVLIMALLGWNIPDWLGISLYGLGCLLGVGVNVALYPLLMSLAEQGRREVLLEGERIRWRTGYRWREVDLRQPYWAKIAAGFSGLRKPNASIQLKPGEVMFHLQGAVREEILRAFPEPYFVGELAVTPAEGLGGFNLTAEDETMLALFYDLLAALWRTRENNEYYRLFRKFPWDTPPSPAFTHIEVIDSRAMSMNQRAFVERLESQVISAPSHTAKLTPDYLLGSDKYRYFIMPLGYIQAEPGPSGTSEAGNYLKVTGLDRDQHPLTIKLDYWVMAGDRQYEEGQFFVRFVNRQW